MAATAIVLGIAAPTGGASAAAGTGPPPLPGSTSTPGAAGQGPRAFSDVPPRFWAYRAIGALAAQGIVSGRPDGTFGPEAAVTRAQFVKMLDLTLGYRPTAGTTPFTDVPATAWFAPYVTAANRAGITTGVSPTLFAPRSALSRQQMAVLLARALDLRTLAPLPFSDRERIDLWALVGVEEAVGAGYVHGFPDGSFRPLATATRAQAASLLATVLSRRSGFSRAQS